MNNIHIPEYRAKKIDSDEYVEGYLVTMILPIVKGDIDKQVWVIADFINKKPYVEVDPSTLSIHFPDMIDSEGTKIFASLSEDGKGGDIVTTIDNDTAIMVLKDIFQIPKYSKNIKVTGIQQ